MQRATGADATNRLKMAEVARRVRLNKSTVKRYCDRYELIGDDGLVDLDAFVRHRAENVTVEDTPPLNPVNDAKARRADADADIREMELAEKRGDLVERGPFLDEIHRLIADLLSGIEGAIEPALRDAGVPNTGEAAKKVIEAIHARRRAAIDRLDGPERDSELA